MSRVLAALVLVSLLCIGPAPAHAEAHRGQLTYTCDVAPEGYEDDARPYPMVVALQLDVPDQVRPGDTLSLAGTFSVQLPEELRSLAADYFTYAQAVSDTVTIPVTVGGRTVVLRASRFDSGRVATKNQPLILSGVVSAAPYAVPAGAAGDLQIELPANGSARSNIDGSRVAFSAEALLSGGFVATFVKEYTYLTACSAPQGARRTVATIAVTPADHVGTSTTAGESPTRSTDAADADRAAADPAKTSTPTATPGAVAPDGGRAITTAEPSQAAAAIPPAARSEVVVPGWLLVVVAAAVMLGALLMAGWSHHRVRMYRASLEG